MSLLKVLVVDDQADIVDSFANCIAQWGHEVKKAYSGEEALEVAEEFWPDVVLLDIIMPTMDGYTVANELRAMNATIVGVTALQSENYRHKSWDCGFHFYFVKPVDLEKLKILLNSLKSTAEYGKNQGISALTRKLQKTAKNA